MDDSVALIRILLYSYREAKLLNHREAEKYLVQAIVKLYVDIKKRQEASLDEEVVAEVELIQFGGELN